jgi:1,4-alpha-glucan branching enzyme
VLGSFCLVLHGHLPYVLRHGRTPHGENWLHEAAAETYLPLLALIDELQFLGARPAFALGLTPILLEQLAHPVFRAGFRAYLAERRERARSDRREFEETGEPHLAYLATRWDEWYGERSEQFEALAGDLPAAFAARMGAGLQLLGSAATHAYLPLLFQESSVRAQVRAGQAASRRCLGTTPRGFWLPECAYRPRGPWTAPIAWAGHADRTGTERIVADAGVTHFFVEHTLLGRARPTAARNGGAWHAVGPEEAQSHPRRGWRSVNEPHGVDSDGELPPRVSAFARDAEVCEQVWSGSIGYPADGAYLDFHKQRSAERGLRYWKVTDARTGLADKQPYHPDDVSGRVHAHATHFCGLVKDRLRAEKQRTGREGIVVAAFDAELFGHWWFEGPRFLRDVLLTLNADPEIALETPEHVLERAPPDKVVALPEGSWGEGGDHRVWTDPSVHWMWEVEYRCETSFGRATFDLPWRENAGVRGLLERAARELLLLQASDWPFAITRGQAVDYGIKRFVLHVSRFDALLEACDVTARGSGGKSGKGAAELDEVLRHAVQDVDLHDVVFPEIDLSWWRA